VDVGDNEKLLMLLKPLSEDNEDSLGTGTFTGPSRGKPPIFGAPI
jgi:hypothetical protein